MANTPATHSVLKYKDTGNVRVDHLLPTQALDPTQDGSDVGTGGPGVATTEAASAAGNFTVNRNASFLNDRYCLTADTVDASSGVYRKDQGGADQWGRVNGGLGFPFEAEGACSGLHVLHPGGIQTMAYLMQDSTDDMRLRETLDGATWTPTVIEASSASPATYGQSIVFNTSIFWAHSHFTGSGGSGAITSYDLETNTFARYDVSALFDTAQEACQYTFHVHENVLYLFGWADTSKLGRVAKLDTGAFSTIYTDADIRSNSVGASYNHSAMFSSPSDLVIILTGSPVSTPTNGDVKVVSIADPNGVATDTDRTSAMLGSVEGADKYLEGNAAEDSDRRWVVNRDSDTDPLIANFFLTTVVPGGVTETWRYVDLTSELEASFNLKGISDDYALPYSSAGGGHRSPRSSGIEFSGAHEEVPNGTKFIFNCWGTGSVRTITFYGGNDGFTGDVVVPILPLSFTIESGSPATTPVIVGNTLTNLTPDSGVAVYSIELDVDAAGVDIAEGDIGIIVAK